MFHLVFESHDGRALGAESEEKREPVSDIDTEVVDSLKVLDPDGRLEKRPTRCVATKRRDVGLSRLKSLSKQSRTHCVGRIISCRRGGSGEGLRDGAGNDCSIFANAE